MATDFLTQKETADRLGISPRHVSRLKSQGVLTTLELEGERWPKYPWPKVRDEWRDYQLRIQEREHRGESEEEILERGRMDPKRRRDLARARLAELEVEEKSGRLIPMDVHRRVVEELADLFQAQIDGIPGRWWSELIGLRDQKEAVQVLRELKDELLEDARATITREIRGNGKRPT